MVLVTVLTEHVPTVDTSKRWSTEPIGKGLVRVLLRYGFMEKPNVPEALRPALAELRLPAGSPLYVLGREHLVVGPKGRMGWLSERVFAFLARNARSVTDDFSLPVEQVVELGMELDSVRGGAGGLQSEPRPERAAVHGSSRRKRGPPVCSTARRTKPHPPLPPRPAFGGTLRARFGWRCGAHRRSAGSGRGVRRLCY